MINYFVTYLYLWTFLKKIKWLGIEFHPMVRSLKLQFRKKLPLLCAAIMQSVISFASTFCRRQQNRPLFCLSNKSCNITKRSGSSPTKILTAIWKRASPLKMKMNIWNLKKLWIHNYLIFLKVFIIIALKCNINYNYNYNIVNCNWF